MDSLSCSFFMDKYEQIRTLGQGGYGRAILVRRKSDNEMFVVKEVRLSSMSAADRDETCREAQVLSSLKHPYIVQFEESFQERGCFYIVMEYADGGDLSQKIKRRGSKLFSEEEIVHDFMQLALAIKYIHDRRILHRDLKAQNVFLMRDGTIKLGDFGIARVLEHTFQLCKTQIGSPYYLSPEICEGKSYDSKTDVWSLGCILYELCTLKHAFNSANMNGLLMNIVRGKYSPIHPTFSSELRHIIGRMLTKNPSERPSIKAILASPMIRVKLSHLLEESQSVTKHVSKSMMQVSDPRANMEEEKRRMMVSQSRNAEEVRAVIYGKREERHKNRQLCKQQQQQGVPTRSRQASASMTDIDIDTPPISAQISHSTMSSIGDSFVRGQQRKQPAWARPAKAPSSSKKKPVLEARDRLAVSRCARMTPPPRPKAKEELNWKYIDVKQRKIKMEPVVKLRGDDGHQRLLDLQRREIEQKRLRMCALELGVYGAEATARDAMIAEIEAELDEDPLVRSVEEGVRRNVESVDRLLGSTSNREMPRESVMPRLRGKLQSAPRESVSAARSHLLNIQALADSIRDALAFSPADDVEPEPEPQTKSQFYIGNKQLNFPVVNDGDSACYRAEAIRAFLERELGLDRVISLRQELLDQEKNPFDVPVCDIDPGLVILAQQLVILDETIAHR